MATPPPTKGHVPVYKNKKVMIAVAVILVIAAAYYIHHRGQSAAGQDPGTISDDTGTTDSGLGSAGTGDTSGGSSGSGSGDDSGLLSILESQMSNDAQLSLANSNLYGSVITNQEGLIVDLAGSVQSVSMNAIGQLGNVAASQAGALATFATSQGSKAATTAVPSSTAEDHPADGGGGSGVYSVTSPITEAEKTATPAQVAAATKTLQKIPIPKLGVQTKPLSGYAQGSNANLH